MQCRPDAQKQSEKTGEDKRDRSSSAGIGDETHEWRTIRGDFGHRNSRRRRYLHLGTNVNDVELGMQNGEWILQKSTSRLDKRHVGNLIAP